jgi:hypothetical protein
MAMLKSLLTLLLEAFAPIIKEIILESIKDTVEDSLPDVALRERLLRRVRDANNLSS